MPSDPRSRAAFRRYLDAQDAASRDPVSHRHGVYHQRTRLYGTYLWHQDREKFDVDYQEWLRQQPGGKP